MKLVIQRVTKANLSIEEKNVSNIKKGLLVLIGISRKDMETENLDEKMNWLVRKLINLRIFEDENGKMNHSVEKIKGEILLVSQFTLYADCRKGNRPSFTKAAKPEFADKIYKKFGELIERKNIPVKYGKFGEHMSIDFINDGPVTIILEK